MEHLLIIDKSLKGREYGTLTSFQEAIRKYTNAKVLVLPKKTKCEERYFQTSRLSFLRSYKNKTNINIPENHFDVVWYICMGPENYRFDLLYGLEKIKNRIVYFFDTLPHQFSLIKRLNISQVFNIQITSFDDALYPLEKLTNSKWHYIQQSSSKVYFNEKKLSEKDIGFASFGRGNKRLNDIIQKYCDLNNIIFERTHEIGGEIITNNKLLYESYCRVLSNSIFSICFPVEVTNPNRAGDLSPITCRWYESFLAQNIVIGKEPVNQNFKKIFPSNFVHEINFQDSEEKIIYQLDLFWSNKEKLFDELYGGSEIERNKFDWNSRIAEILIILKNTL